MDNEDDLPDGFVLNVPRASLQDIDTESLKRTLQTPKLRGPDVVMAISIAANLATAASAFATIAVAREDLAEVCHRLVRWVRRQPTSGSDLRVTFGNRFTRIDLESHAPDRQLVQALLDLVQEAQTDDSITK